MATKLPYPDFASETEEADWLYEHREELDLYFSPMEATLREMLLRDHDLVLADAYVSVPLSKEEAASAKALADADGITSTDYICRVVHDALKAKQAA
jgi:hypothetical protein